ncbi:MAG TPA: glutamyl-tRNA reductase [Ktedonobacterales bacterium]|jgi:glutamyl-tRNA reductase|nr:glutamyl-tRNA reductase [Ktedonobacterales bacterium]
MIGLVGLDHTNAGVELRGRLVFSAERLPEALRELAARPSLGEVVIVSTCNRTEVYAAASDWAEARADIRAFLAATLAAAEPVEPIEAAEAATIQHDASTNGRAHAQRASVTRTAAARAPRGSAHTLPDELARSLYEFEGLDAAGHILRVACGLRSMVVGEAQILGQVKEALAAAESAGTAGEELRALFTQAIKTGKRARAETEIGRADVSVGALAVRVAADLRGDLAGACALVIGAGRTSQLCASLLREAGIGRLILANRTLPAAGELAEAVGGEAIALADIAVALPDVDLVISATAAPHIVLKASIVAAAVAGRSAPLLVIDLAVPPDVDESVATIPSVTLRTLDSLRVADSPDGLAAGDREVELARVEAIAEDGVREYSRVRAVRLAVPGIAALRRHVDASERAELDRALAQLDQLSAADRAVVERFGQRLVDKMFHHLVSRIRSLAEYDQVPLDLTMRVLARLFADPEMPQPPRDGEQAGG